jgi:hypothetical protein
MQLSGHQNVAASLEVPMVTAVPVESEGLNHDVRRRGVLPVNSSGENSRNGSFSLAGTAEPEVCHVSGLGSFHFGYLPVSIHFATSL